jgi:hypothetical protein
VFENRALRRIFGPKKVEVTGGWRGQHNEKLYKLYYSPSIIRLIKSTMMKWAGNVTCTGAKGSAYKIFVRNPRGKKFLGRPRHKREDNIKVDFR